MSNGAWGQSALASLDVNSLGNGVSGPTGGELVASGSSESYTAVLNTAPWCPNADFLAKRRRRPYVAGGVGTAECFGLGNLDRPRPLQRLSVLRGHSDDPNNRLRRRPAGASIPSQSFTIYNLAANTSAAYTANLKLTGFATGGDPALSTNLSTFNGLSAGNGNTFTASLNTSNYTTTGINTVTMSAAQLADDSNLPGQGTITTGR